MPAPAPAGRVPASTTLPLVASPTARAWRERQRARPPSTRAACRCRRRPVARMSRRCSSLTVISMVCSASRCSSASSFARKWRWERRTGTTRWTATAPSRRAWISLQRRASLQDASATTRSRRSASTATAGLGALTRMRGSASVAAAPKPTTIADAIANPTQPSAGGSMTKAVTSAATARTAAIDAKMRATFNFAPQVRT